MTGDAKRVERPSLLTGLARSGIALGAVAVVAARELLENQRSELWGFALAGAAGIALLAGLSGLFTARTTKFIADAEEFRVERKFLSESSQRVDYTKVQAVELSQPFVARLLGLAKVHIDVGGAGGVDLAFLRLRRAEEMRELLLALASQARAGSLAEAPADPEVEIVSLAPATLAIGTLISTQALASLIGAAIVVGVTWWTRSPVAIVGGTLGVVGWLWARFGGNWGFRMTRSGDTLRITRGLASRTAQGVRPERIQGVLITQDLLQRLTGLYRMHVTVLGFQLELEDASKATNSLVLPFGSRADVDRVLQAIWPGVRLPEATHRPPRRARWLIPLAYHWTAWGADEQFLVSRTGWLTRSTTAVPRRRVQSLGASQGPLQRRLGLATVEAHTTDGPVKLEVRHLSESDARSWLVCARPLDHYLSSAGVTPGPQLRREEP